MAIAIDSGAFEATVLVAAFVAGAARTLIPYLSKRQGDISSGVDPRPFSWSYIRTGLLGVIPVAVGSILLLPTILPQVPTGGSQLMVFVTAFGLAYTTTDLVNRNVSTLTTQIPVTKATQAQIEQPKPDLPVKKEDIPGLKKDNQG